MTHLIGDYYLDRDKYNYILKKRFLRENGKYKGKEEFETLGYYGFSLQLLLNALVDKYCLDEIENLRFGEMLKFINDVLEVKKELIK